MTPTLPLQPPRQTDLGLLVPHFADRMRRVMAGLTAQGLDPIVYETLRTRERQQWLYGIGRTHDRGRKPVTWTLHSKHLIGKAIDLISRSRGWDWPEFYSGLKIEALTEGLRDCRGGKAFALEQCHIQWGG